MASPTAKESGTKRDWVTPTMKKDGTNTASARMVTLPSGKKVFSGAAGDDAPATPPAAGATHE